MEKDSVERIYWSIRDAAESLNENRSTLRYWELRFGWITIKKDKKGNRRYIKDNIKDFQDLKVLIRGLKLTEAGVDQAVEFGYFAKLVESTKLKQITYE